MPKEIKKLVEPYCTPEVKIAIEVKCYRGHTTRIEDGASRLSAEGGCTCCHHDDGYHYCYCDSKHVLLEWTCSECPKYSNKHEMRLY